MCCDHASLIFFNDTATTEIYTLSLHDALPIFAHHGHRVALDGEAAGVGGVLRDRHADPGHSRRVRPGQLVAVAQDRKSTRLNSSHANISYAVFCLKKKKSPRTCTRTLADSTST